MEYDHGAGHSLVLLGEPYGTPIPRQRCCCRWRAGCTAPHPPDTPPYGLLPNMSESSGNPGREPRSGFFRVSVSLAEPCPRLTPVIISMESGDGCRSKKNLLR